MSDSMQDAQRALERLSDRQFVLTTAHEGRRCGVLVSGAARAATEPMLVAAFVRRGHWIEPLIRDSRVFALCQVPTQTSAATSLLLRRFAEASRPRDGDPFDGFDAGTLTTGAPILIHSPLAFDCDVHRHIDLDADHEVYCGVVRAVVIDGRRIILEPPPPPGADRRVLSDRRTFQRRKPGKQAHEGK
ncbi:MAG: flavin reductase [Leptolyngbya sp. PLA1]|nr:flavin reductase [Leptolyngbya sp. PLA1]